MYNESLKEAFLAQRGNKPTTEKIERTILESISGIERSLNADACTWDFDQAQSAINQISRLRKGSQTRQLFVLQEYVRWCITQVIPGACDGMLKVKGANFDRMREMTVSGPEDLQKCLNDVFSPESTEDITSIYRCYFWCGFAGMDEGDVFKLTARDIDFANLRICFGGKTYTLYEQSVPAFRNAVMLTDFHTSDERVQSSRKPRSDGVHIMRGTTGVPKTASFRAMMSRAFRKDGVRELTYKRVKLSGRFYEVWMAELRGSPPDFTTAIPDASSAKSGEVRRKAGVTANELLSDYIRWKNAFHLELR